MTTHQQFYRGDLDDQVVTANNGAKVHHAYAEFVKGGPWAEVSTHPVTPRVHTITGYGIANHTFIEGDTGLIMIDTGQNIGAGLEALKMKEAFSDKPIVAVIYTHHHYTRGTKAVAESYPETEMPVYGHPDVDENLQALFSYLAPGRFQRGFIQFGHHLPKEGPDATYGIEEPAFKDPALNAGGHLPVTHPVADGEEVIIDGLRAIFHHAVADTEDSLIVHFPELDTVVHNTAVMGFLFPMYTLRGDFHRFTPDVLESIDQLRALNAKHLIGCHGYPISGTKEVYEFATAHRDALAYVYQQTVRGINHGLGPDELARAVRLPTQLTAVPELYPAYVDVEHMVRGIYSGLIGWFANDTATLHPPATEELATEIVRGFGGAEILVKRARDVLEERRYNLAATLAGYILADDPDQTEARSVRAAALRQMAYATPTGIQTRNFLLHEALLLEGAIANNAASQGRLPLPVEALVSMPVHSLLEMFAYGIDGAEAAELVTTVAFEFTDTDERHALAIRHGSTELLDNVSGESGLIISISKLALAELLVGKNRLQELIDNNRAEIGGDERTKAFFRRAFSHLN